MFAFGNADPLTAGFVSRTANGLRLEYGKLKRLPALSGLANRKSPGARPITPAAFRGTGPEPGRIRMRKDRPITSRARAHESDGNKTGNAGGVGPAERCRCVSCADVAAIERPREQPSLAWWMSLLSCLSTGLCLTELFFRSFSL